MTQNSTLPILWYFADPMCSWCWGFSPVISQVKANYENQLKIALVMGGLRAGETEPMSASSREDILHHWHQVRQMTGQSFDFENALPDGFIYNTELACRAVITVAQLDKTKTFEYFTSVQAAFYAINQDVTQASQLQQLATDIGLDGNEFIAVFNSENNKQATQKSFQFSRQAGVQGFPTLILNQGETLHVLSRGFQDYATLSGKLDQLLAE